MWRMALRRSAVHSLPMVPRARERRRWRWRRRNDPRRRHLMRRLHHLRFGCYRHRLDRRSVRARQRHAQLCVDAQPDDR